MLPGEWCYKMSHKNSLFFKKLPKYHRANRALTKRKSFTPSPLICADGYPLGIIYCKWQVLPFMTRHCSQTKGILRKQTYNWLASYFAELRVELRPQTYQARSPSHTSHEHSPPLENVYNEKPSFSRGPLFYRVLFLPVLTTDTSSLS